MRENKYLCKFRFFHLRFKKIIIIRFFSGLNAGQEKSLGHFSFRSFREHKVIRT